MSMFGALTEKSWLTPGLDPATRDSPDAPHYDKGIGLGVFMAVVAFLFTLLTTAYLMRMGIHEALGHAGSDWYPLGEPPLLWLNTALLLASSLAFHLAFAGARSERAAWLRLGVIAGGLLGAAFLAGQLLLWFRLDDLGYVLSLSVGVCATGGLDPLAPALPEFRSGNPAIAFFYLITGLHGLHILGGMAAWAFTAARMIDGAAPAALARTVQLCARYWHFLLLVWLAMLTLFVST